MCVINIKLTTLTIFSWKSKYIYNYEREVYIWKYKEYRGQVRIK